MPPVAAASESTVNRSWTAGSLALDGDDAATKVDRCVVELPRGMATATRTATPIKRRSAAAPTAHGRLVPAFGSLGSFSATDDPLGREPLGQLSGAAQANYQVPACDP